MLRLPLAGARHLALAALAVTFALPAAASATQYETHGAAVWKTNAAPMGWSASLDRIVYNARGSDGLWDAYSAARDGSDERCLTCATPVLPGAGTGTHRGAGDVDPKGDLMLVQVERGQHFGKIGAVEAEPGKGAYSDVWLQRTDGTQAWPLTDIYTAGSDAMGTMWPRFDRTGNKLVWAELYAPAIFNLGAWRLKVADIAWADGTPRLANVRTYQPEKGRFYEPYGFSPDNRRILFASDMGMPNWWDSQIFEVDADFAAPARRLSPADPAPGFFTNYNEFAFYVPQGDHILYARTTDATKAGLDYWLMRPDGTESRRLTFLNEPWHLQGRGYAAVGGMAWDPRDPNRFVAGVASDSAGEVQTAMMFDLGRYEQPAGLRGEYFKDTKFTTPVATRVENPSVGLRWTGSPAPGVAAGTYAARWTGTIESPTTGRYRFCVKADDGVRMWLDDQQLVEAWYLFGGRRCVDVDRTAGQRSRIRIDYWNIWGDGLIQLTWAPPAATTGDSTLAATATPTDSIIPAARMSPDAGT